MITKDNKLEIFENFIIDGKLPKYASKKRSEIDRSVRQYIDWRQDHSSFEMDESKSADGESDSDEQGILFTPEPVKKPTIKAYSKTDVVMSVIFTVIFYPYLCIRDFFRRRRLAKAEASRISIQQFFISVKNSIQELEIIKERAKGFEKVILDAGKTGQIALKEQLIRGLEAHRCETQLFASGSTKYLTEEDVVKFVKQSKKGLRLDWIKNFTKIIPQAIIAIKSHLDELLIFDNYVILHYDPNKKSWLETEVETRARKDPILFGVINGSRKLYFVGDWTDDLCDLTLEQIAEKLGKEVIKNIK